MEQSRSYNAQIILHADQPKGTISPEIYGHFAEHLGRGIYEGLWVGADSPIPNTRGIRNDVLAALKNLNIPVLRWPGGCFADEYHWKNGVGPREKRVTTINSHWGGVIETNQFGTHEFMDLCELLNTQAYVCGNVGSGSVEEMMEWVQYMTSDSQDSMASLRRKNGREKPWRLKYFGVGNENWGCGGDMRAEYYADIYKRYNIFVKNFSGNKVERIACGSSGTDLHWTEVLMANATAKMNGLSLHWYTLPTADWARKGSATDFTEEHWHATLVQTLRMEELVTKHAAIMDKHDPERKVGMIVDEWGTWYDPTPGSHPGFLEQHNTLRDAIVAGINLNIFNQHCDRVTMTNIAQMINVLQAMILTDKEKMILTPTYHVFEMFKVHQGATLIPVDVKSPDYKFGDKSIPGLSASASRDASGKIHLSIVSLDPNRASQVTVSGLKTKNITGRIITAPAMNTHNTFDRPDEVKSTAFTRYELNADQVTVSLPAKSVVTLEIQ
jgi:alpha-L-arabinofuranosidase